MKKIIITIMAIITTMTLVSCKSEPAQPTLGPNGVETITAETITVENIEVENITYENVSDEYLAEVEFNSQSNRW